MAGAEAAYEHFHFMCLLQEEAYNRMNPVPPPPRKWGLRWGPPPYQGKPTLRPDFVVRRVLDRDLSPEEFRRKYATMAHGECPSSVCAGGDTAYCDAGAGHDGMHRADVDGKDVTWVEMDSPHW